MTGPYFETWSHENLAKFAKDAYVRLQEQEKGVQEFEIYRLGYKQGASDERRALARENAMTQDELFDMAKEAGFMQHLGVIAIPNVLCLERFAALVAKAEREACAKLCDGEGLYMTAAAIRARGQA